MARLVLLDLTSCKELRDSGLAEVVQLVSLRNLSLAYCSQLTNSGWIALSRLTSLTSLDLRGCGEREHLKCSTLCALYWMPHLYRLNMGNARWQPGALTPLADISTITQLALSDCSCWTSIDLTAVCCMRRMRDLDLQGCHLLYGVWFRQLAAFSNLQRLSVVNCIVNPQQLDQLYRDCPTLRMIQS